MPFVTTKRTSLFNKILIVLEVSLLITAGNGTDSRSSDYKGTEIRKCPESDFKGTYLKIPNELLLKKDNLTESLVFGIKSENLELSGLAEIETLKILIVNGSSTIFSEMGYLKLNNTYYSPSEYCIQSKTDEEIIIKLLSSPCSSTRPCIKKCCELDEVWDMSQFEKDGKIACQSSGKNKWSPTFYENRHEKLSKELLAEIQPRFISNHPKNWCEGHFSILTLKQINHQDVTPFKILRDGSVLEKVSRTKWSSISHDKYCIDGVQNIPSGSGTSGHYSGAEMDTIVLDCRGFDEETQSDSIESGSIYVVAMSIAIIFLFLTILSHCILWKKQNIHGWTLMGYVISLLFQFAFLISARLIVERGFPCTFVAIGTHFSSLSTFAWLTTMNFDVWLTFKTMNPSPGRASELRSFRIYALFAMAVPVTIVSVALSLDHVYGEDSYSEVIVPGYGQEKCGLDRSAELPYLFGPISVLLATNFIFIFTTLYYVYRSQKILKSNGVKSKLLNHKIRFFGMLFLVAGVTWIFDVISWAATLSTRNEPTPWYWVFFDLVNILQAIAIFLIFVCNPHTIGELRQEIPCFSKVLELFESKSKEDLEADGTRKMSQTQVSNVVGGCDDLELQ